ncbi:MAG: hypothetical protein HY980_01710 [Candidatus Magasanikbacteria bacterium]|nr:hypothetical protein [Candidatus Magasanikbacteria bacterium]
MVSFSLVQSLRQFKKVNNARQARQALRTTFRALLFKGDVWTELRYGQLDQIIKLLHSGLDDARTAPERAKIAFRILIRIFNRPGIKKRIGGKQHAAFMQRYYFIMNSINRTSGREPNEFLKYVGEQVQALITALRLA